MLWRIEQRLTRKLPPSVDMIVGRLENAINPKLDIWGGPFNGQKQREQTVFSLLRGFFHPYAIIETGTHYGSTTEFFSKLEPIPVYTVEQNRNYYRYAQQRFIRQPHIHISNLDSRVFLKELAASHDISNERIFFYLDAHWNVSDVPLTEELEIIGQRFYNSIIMIDDFQVPDDPMYDFDTYGSVSFTMHHFGSLFSKLGFLPFFPMVSGRDEIGYKRGCVILGDKESSLSIRESQLFRAFMED